MLWAIVSLFMRAYVVALFVSSTFISVSTLRILGRLFRKGGHTITHGDSADFQKWTAILQSRLRLVGFLALLLAVVMAREILASISAVRNSYASLSEYRLQDALEAPVAFCLASTIILALVYALLWWTERQVQRRRPSSSIRQASAE
ncbi:MAG TPA: hypothetical protein VOA78_10490 [Candidatus Dormibacteraeota bacterium]|nr:hypothetical protein [Candidatus Dormibacteraeota bacterium]